MLGLNDVVAETGGILKRLIPADIEIVAELDTALGYVEADRGQIEQVLMNLAVNARDAMPRGGELMLQVLADEQAVIGVEQKSNRVAGADRSAHQRLDRTQAQEGKRRDSLPRVSRLGKQGLEIDSCHEASS